MTDLPVFSDLIPYERLLIEAWGQQSHETQHALNSLKNLLHVEPGNFLSQTSLLNVLLPVKDNLMVALDALSQKSKFAQFSTQLSVLISKANKAQSWADLNLVIEEAVAMLFP